MIENKYKKWYDRLIEFRRNNLLTEEYEKHHILPRSLGGTNEENNLVRLSYREHFVAHLLLTKFVSSKEEMIKMCWAVHRLAYSKQGAFSSREYEIARRIHRKNLIENHHCRRIPGWSQMLSDSRKAYYQTSDSSPQRQAISAAQRKNWSENYEKMRSIAINNLKNDGSRVGRNNPATIEIEYLGKIYYGWSELRASTGVTRDNYKANYNGSNDLSNRIGRPGPKTVEIEYGGEMFYGWNDLKRRTGISKYTYINSYRKGESVDAASTLD